MVFGKEDKKKLIDAIDSWHDEFSKNKKSNVAARREIVQFLFEVKQKTKKQKNANKLLISSKFFFFTNKKRLAD